MGLTQGKESLCCLCFIYFTSGRYFAIEFLVHSSKEASTKGMIKFW